MTRRSDSTPDDGQSMPPSPMDRLPRLGADDPVALQRAAREFVLRKHQIDDWRREPATRWRVLSDIPEQIGRSMEPHTYVEQVLPFASDRYAKEWTAVSAEVPVDRTIGEDWKQRQQTELSDSDRERFRAELTDPLRAEPTDRHAASYTWFKPLGIIAAGEGKNRVRFLQDLGEAWVPAHVSCRDYPAPERIRLFLVDLCGHLSVWATLDEKQLQAVPYYTLGADLLQAYGVKPPVPWPARWPSPVDVVHAYTRQHAVPGFTSVDLDQLREKSREDHAETSLSIHDIEWLRWNHKPWLVLVGLTALSTAVVLFAPWDNVRYGAMATVMGITLGLGVMGLPLWRGRRVQARGC